jgi:superfamily I DNA/RNA helicase
LSAKNDDYVAHRTILGQRIGTGILTSHRICEAVVSAGLNYRDIFYNPLPNGVFDTRCTTAINHARAVCAKAAEWKKEDTLSQRQDEIIEIISSAYGTNGVQAWQAFVSSLPLEIQLLELRDVMGAENDEQRALLLANVYERQGLPPPLARNLLERVRLMTMHGAKGLSARVVFIPGLEDQLIPGPWRQPYPGLVLEAARLLYVSLTRARAACVLSYSQRRTVNGLSQQHVASRFTNHLKGPFVLQNGGLSPAEAQSIVVQCAGI